MERSVTSSATISANAAPRPRTTGRWAAWLGMQDPKRFSNLLVFPAQYLLLAIVVFPLLMEVYISLTAWSPTRGGNWWEAYQYWDWGQNYGEVLRDSAFWSALWRTVVIVGIAVPLEFLLGFCLAFLFLDEFPGKRIFHTIMLTPMMIVPAVVGYMFYMLFQSSGPINGLLSILTGQSVTIPWLTTGPLAMASVIIAEVWQWTPLMFLILLSGLVGLPEDEMKAATILGASFWQKFRYIMLPKMKLIIVIALVIRFMEAFKIFDSIFLMTGGGPARATESISIYMYKEAFQNIRWSFAAAAAIIILVLMTIVASYALRPLQVPQSEESHEPA
ncbi:MAG: Trehalose transport system permease protein SugA [Anaerolineae bacterium]|nr:Trehalose transport system permease protein SugA [Anaerolineae bacterium]